MKGGGCEIQTNNLICQGSFREWLSNKEVWKLLCEILERDQIHRKKGSGLDLDYFFDCSSTFKMADLMGDDPAAEFLQQEEDQLRELGIDADPLFDQVHNQ